MIDNEITYTTVRFHRSSELQNRARPDGTQRSREAGHRESSTPWLFIVIPLGILCSVLLVTVAVLVTLIFQCSQEKYDQNNLDQSTVQNTSASNKTLTNKAPENEGCKNQEEQKRCCGKTKAVLDYGKYTGKCAEAHLFCCGIKCYYFIMDNKHWSGCKQTCQDCSFSLLKIDDDDELSASYTRKGNCLGFALWNPEVRLLEMSNWMAVENVTDLWAKVQNGDYMRIMELYNFSDKFLFSLQMFLKYQLTTNTFWIGLSYEISKSKWGWIDNGTSKLDLMKLKLLKENGTCACLSFRGIREGDCGTKRPCICEKRMDRFPDSVYSMKGK
ncbi:killer cell lectin-like receptor 2 [Arvicola amphibius]|uniref:killer cell lectin-like receptor 2 n=1 Tax=Arvicola amphibius TaxID=1047088 RepID=UPI001C08CCCC|nr:killer cell lectin-like receptor 2 [Arvicola amphibius]